jgi:hypothetical protein
VTAADDPVMAPSAQFILFQGRIVNTAHLASLIPPRPDGGKFVIEARMVGNVAFLEEYEDDEVAAGRYLDLASQLLGDLGVASGITRDDGINAAEATEVVDEPEPEVVLPVGDADLAELTAKLRRELAEGIDVR